METHITCPYCGNREEIAIPENSAEYQHRCDRCKRIIHARLNDHCVICSYGDKNCDQR